MDERRKIKHQNDSFFQAKNKQIQIFNENQLKMIEFRWKKCKKKFKSEEDYSPLPIYTILLYTVWLVTCVMNEFELYESWISVNKWLLKVKFRTQTEWRKTERENRKIRKKTTSKQTYTGTKSTIQIIIIRKNCVYVRIITKGKKKN